MLKEWMIFTCNLLTLAGTSLPLNGCISRGQESIFEGAAFGAGILREPGTTKKADTKDLNVSPLVYGPLQVIFRIDDNRYLTLEDYTHRENGQTSYNSRAKNTHAKILDASGYLFKGHLFWLSTRDDLLAFPAALDTRHAPCMGPNKGCVDVVIIITDGRKRCSDAPYGGYTQNLTGAAGDYDMLVMNDGFHLFRYRGGQGRFSPVIFRWILSTGGSSGVVHSEGAYELFRPGKEIPPIGFYRIDLSCFYPKSNVMEMQCDGTLEPIQPSESRVQ